MILLPLQQGGFMSRDHKKRIKRKRRQARLRRIKARVKSAPVTKKEKAPATA